MKPSLFRISPALLGLACLLTGCAGGGLSVGLGSGGIGLAGTTSGSAQANASSMTPAVLQDRLGAPTGIYALPQGGQRLQYSQMPAGFQVWNYDFDVSGQLTGQDQALRYENFNRIVPGQTRQEEILLNYGRPVRVVQVARFDGPVWDYRFSDINNPRIISIHIDRAGVLQRVVYTDIDRRRMFGMD
jgi:hypothetical protein